MYGRRRQHGHRLIHTYHRLRLHTTTGMHTDIPVGRTSRNRYSYCISAHKQASYTSDAFMDGTRNVHTSLQAHTGTRRQPTQSRASKLALRGHAHAQASGTLTGEAYLPTKCIQEKALSRELVHITTETRMGLEAQGKQLSVGHKHAVKRIRKQTNR
jgi:hypothetical protein